MQQRVQIFHRRHDTNRWLNADLDFRGWIVLKKAEDAGGPLPVKDENAF